MCATDGIIYPGFPYQRDDENLIILPEVEEQTGKITAECLKTLVVFIGGAADDGFQPMLSRVFSPYEAQFGQGNQRKQDVSYSEHGGGNVPPLMNKWNDAKQKIVLIGHSWGGHRVISLAEENPDISIELLVTLDPVSRSRSGKQPKPKNVKRWLNVFVDYSVADGTNPNIIARIGGAWGYCDYADVNKSVNTKQKNGEDFSAVRINSYGHENADKMFDKVRNDVISL